MSALRPTLSLAALLLTASHVGAQAAGDSVRVRFGSSRDWIHGRILQSDSLGFTLRSGIEDHQYRAADAMRVDRWKRDNLAVHVLVNAALNVVSWELLFAHGKHARTFTGNQNADVAVAAGIGASVALVAYAFEPGTWHRIRRVRPANQ
jgi:hypothetical protein